LRLRLAPSSDDATLRSTTELSDTSIIRELSMEANVQLSGPAFMASPKALNIPEKKVLSVKVAATKLEHTTWAAGYAARSAGRMLPA
jgi:hypothetical protein